MNNELYHYGVPGMKWGQRKSKLERVSERSKKRGWSDDATEVAKIKTKRVSQMSNNELRKVNDRKSLEQNYGRLNPNAIKKGLLIAGGVAAAMGTVTLLYKNSKEIIKIGKELTKKVGKKITPSGKFWNGVKNMSKMGNDFTSLLK